MRTRGFDRENKFYRFEQLCIGVASLQAYKLEALLQTMMAVEDDPCVGRVEVMLYVSKKGFDLLRECELGQLNLQCPELFRHRRQLIPIALYSFLYSYVKNSSPL